MVTSTNDERFIRTLKHKHKHKHEHKSLEIDQQLRNGWRWNGIPDQRPEEQLADERAGDGLQRRQQQQQLGEAAGHRRGRVAIAVLLQHEMGLVLKQLDAGDVSQTADVCGTSHIITLSLQKLMQGKATHTHKRTWFEENQRFETRVFSVVHAEIRYSAD